MLDTLGAMALTATAVLLVGALVEAGAPDGAARSRIAWGAAIWFAAIAALAASGVFLTPALGTPAIGAAVVVPFLAGATALARSASARAFALGIPPALLVGVHLGRLLGGFFVALHAAGRLPPTFALTAGWGDIAVALAAVPVAGAIRQGARGWRPLAWAWNTIGALDLAAAVSLGVGSAAGSPLRFLFESPDSSAVAMLPWAMIPGFLVPIYALTHVAVFVRLAAGGAEEARVPLRSA